MDNALDEKCHGILFLLLILPLVFFMLLRLRQPSAFPYNRPNSLNGLRLRLLILDGRKKRFYNLDQLFGFSLNIFTAGFEINGWNVGDLQQCL